MGVRRWNGVAILSTSWDISTSGLAATIFKYRLPVTSDSIQKWRHWLAGHRKWGVSRWNGVAILSRSWDISTSGLAAAIFKNRLPVTSDSIRNGAIELLDPKNGGFAVGTALLSCLETEIYVLPVYWPPSWISDFRLHRTMYAIVSLSSWIA